jgi:superfamily II DNA or RNA helicase
VPAPGREAKALLAETAKLQELAATTLKCPEEARAQARSAYEAAVREIVATQLAAMPVARLKETTEGRVRLGAIEAAGITTVERVMSVGPQRLQGIRGVGPETATKLVAAARQLQGALTDSVRLRLDAETRPETHGALLAALETWSATERSVEPLRARLEQMGSRIEELSQRAAPARSRWKMLLAGRDGRETARAALAELDEQVHADDAIELAEGAQRALTAQPPDRVDVWDRYARDAVRLNGLLVDVGGLGPDEDLVHGRLPHEIAERVNAHSLDTALLDVSLRGYQAFGAKFALVQRHAIVGDEMGLGKTIEALAAICHLTSDGATHFLVVCPASVLVNWDHEVARHTKLSAFRLHGVGRERVATIWQRRGGVAITTFDSLKSFVAPDGVEIAMLVVDEAHYVKNPGTQRTTAVQKWVGRANRTLYLTGTPMENRVEEFRTLVAQLQPEVAAGIRAVDGIAGADRFRRAVAPVYLRRNQDDVLDELPPRIESEEWVELAGADFAAYREAVGAGSFMAMRRAAYAPASVAGSAKLARLVEIVDEAAGNGRKVVVFSYFRDVIAAVQGVLGDLVIGTITGAVAPILRQQLVDQFTARRQPTVLVSQIEAGGVGLNMQAASVVILAEPQWKPTTEDQAIARCHRMGQIRPVDVHRLLAEDSVDQRMLEILAGKTTLFNEYVRRSELKEATPDAVDVSGVDVTRDVAGQAELERRIVAVEQRRLGIVEQEPRPTS